MAPLSLGAMTSSAFGMPNTFGLQPACLQGLCPMTRQMRIVDLVDLGKRVANPLSLLGSALISDC